MKEAPCLAAHISQLTLVNSQLISSACAFARMSDMCGGLGKSTFADLVKTCHDPVSLCIPFMTKYVEHTMRTDRPPAASVESACDIGHIVAAFGIAYTFALVWLFQLVRTPVEACPPRRHCIRACLSCCVRAVAARDDRCKYCRTLPLHAQVLQHACDIPD